MALTIMRKSIFGIAFFLLWSVADTAFASPMSAPEKTPQICTETAAKEPTGSLEQLRQQARLVTGQYVLSGRHEMKQSVSPNGVSITTNTLPLTLLDLPNLLAGSDTATDGVLTKKDFPDVEEVSYQKALEDILAFLDLAERWALHKPITRYTGRSLLQVHFARRQFWKEASKKEEKAFALWAIRSLCLTREAVAQARVKPEFYDLPRSFSYILREAVHYDAPASIIKWSTLWLFEALKGGNEDAANEVSIALDLIKAATSISENSLARDIIDWAKDRAVNAPLMSEGNFPERLFALGNLIDGLSRMNDKAIADDLEELLPELETALDDTPRQPGDEKYLTSYDEMIKLARERIRELRSN